MLKILVIEDETFLRENILTWLAFENYEGIGAADGIEGLRAAIQHQPDLIFCDIMMPGPNGYQVLQDLRANSTTQSIPFIFLTARAELDDIHNGMQLGADGYLTKPFSRMDFLSVIKAELRDK